MFSGWGNMIFLSQEPYHILLNNGYLEKLIVMVKNSRIIVNVSKHCAQKATRLYKNKGIWIVTVSPGITRDFFKPQGDMRVPKEL